MSRKSTSTSPLAAKIDQLGITIEEVAAVCRVDEEVVTGWIENGPDNEADVLLRWLNDDHVATLQVEKVRHTVTRGNQLGDGAEHAGIESVPYGTNDVGKTTGGVFS